MAPTTRRSTRRPSASRGRTRSTRTCPASGSSRSGSGSDNWTPVWAVRRRSVMRRSNTIFLAVCLLGGVTGVSADNDNTLDCSRKSLADPISLPEDNPHADQAIRCPGGGGPVVIRVDGIELTGVGAAVIDGGAAADAVAVQGASRVSIAGAEIRNGVNGISATNGAHISLTNVDVHGNFVHG